MSLLLLRNGNEPNSKESNSPPGHNSYQKCSETHRYNQTSSKVIIHPIIRFTTPYRIIPYAARELEVRTLLEDTGRVTLYEDGKILRGREGGV